MTLLVMADRSSHLFEEILYFNYDEGQKNAIELFIFQVSNSFIP